MSWTYLSNGVLVSTTAVYAISTLVFSGEFALSRAIASRRLPMSTVSPGGPRRVVRPGGSTSELLTTDQRTLVERRDVAARIGINLAVLGLVLHGGFLVTRTIASGRPPLSSMFEFTLAASFAATAAYLVIGRQTGQLRQLGLLAMLPVTVAMVLSLATMYSSPQPLVPTLQSMWMSIHVTAAAIGVGALTVGMIGCAVQLKAERDGRHDLLPRADVIARVAFAFAFPVWTLAVMTGAIWAQYAWGRYWGWDPKEVWAFVSWVFLAAYLHSRRTAGISKRTVAIVGLVAYGALLFNFIGVNIWFSGMHSYAGL